MFLEFANNNGKPYIRVAESVRVEKNGKKVIRKKVIKNIGPMDKFDDGKPNYKERLKESFFAGSPLIPELLPYVPKSQPLEKYSFQITQNSPECIGHPKLFSNILLERYLEELDLIQVMHSYKGFSKIQYDLLGYFRLLVYGRLLNPASKIATLAQNESYFEPIIKDYYSYNIYDTLSFISDHRQQIFNRLNSVIAKKYNRKADVLYYDVTNFYFETEEPDDDLTDEDGNITECGIRKMGVSKENRKLPIVQMGLFLDDMGIPVSYEIFPGNTLDHQTVRDSLKNSVDNMDFKRFIFVGDRGMCNYQNLLHILSCGNGYVVSKSIAKCKNVEKEWIFDDSDYIVESDKFKYKSRIVTRTEKDENGVRRKLTEKQVVYWDKYFYDRQIAENKSFLEFLDKLIQSPNSFRITRSQSGSLKKFLKDEYVNALTGEIIQSADLKGMVDLEKVNAYKKEFGYYQIISSETQKSEKEIIEIYHGLTRIEDQFRVMKGDLNTRPMFVRTKEHIDAHLAICTIALTIMRLIQLKTSELIEKDESKCWSYGISARRVQEALNKWTVEEIADGYYRFNEIDDPDLMLILKSFGVEIPHKLYKRGELKKIKSSIEITM